MNINFWAILISSIVSFCLSSLWYSPFLFGNDWINLLKITDRNISEINTSSIIFKYIIHFVTTILCFLILALAIAASGAKSGAEGAIIGFLGWLGFIATMSISRLLWEKDPVKLVLIDAIDSLITLTVGGAIIGAWN